MACSRFVCWLLENRKLVSLVFGWVVVVAAAVATQFQEAKTPMKTVIVVFTFLAFLALVYDYILQLHKDRRHSARCAHLGCICRCWTRLDGTCVGYPGKLSALIVAFCTILSAIGDLVKTIFEQKPNLHVTPVTIAIATLTLVLTMCSNVKKKKNQPGSTEKRKEKVMELWNVSTNTSDIIQKTSNSATFLRMKLAEGVAEGTEGNSELRNGVYHLVECSETLVSRGDKQHKMIEELAEEETIAGIEREKEGK